MGVLEGTFNDLESLRGSSLSITTRLNMIEDKLDIILKVISDPYVKLIELPHKDPESAYQRTIRERYEQIHLKLLQAQVENIS